MVHKGKRPEHRRGTTGRPWRRYRDNKVSQATQCCYGDGPFVTDAQCDHPTHAGMPGCPTHPLAPTLEHPRALIQGGHPRDPDGLVAHFRCNSKRGASLRRDRAHKSTASPLQW